jgi:hypothetical protein
MKVLSTLIIGYVVWHILQAVADWKIFSKAGRPGVLAFIPIVNIYVEYGICWSKFMGLIYLVCVGITSYVSGVQEPSSTLTTVSGVASVAALVLHIVQSIKLAKSFGKGVGYGILLILFGPLARLFLGLGDSRYIGRP